MTLIPVRRLSGLVAALALCAVVTAQEPAPQRPTFSVNSELVLLSVTVRDNRNGYVTGLTEDAFTVLDNGARQTLRFFMTQDAPATIGILVDNSGSMVPNRDLVVAASGAFAETSNREDELFALAFNDDVLPALPEDAPFTSDPGVLRHALGRVATTQGRTALYDAIARGLEQAKRGRHQRHVLVVVSDGDDNASQTGFDHILRDVQASNVVVYAVQIVDPVEETPGRRLKDLAEATGGEVFRPRNPREVLEAMQRIARDIRHTYVLAYEPPAAADSVLRRVRVTVQSLDKKKLTVRTRAGYLQLAATPAPARTGGTP